MGRETSGLIPEEGVIGRIPFDGQWLTEISPTRRVTGPICSPPRTRSTSSPSTMTVARRLSAACVRSSPPNRQSSSTPSGAPCTHPLQELWCLLTTANPTMRRAAPC